MNFSSNGDPVITITDTNLNAVSSFKNELLQTFEFRISMIDHCKQVKRIGTDRIVMAIFVLLTNAGMNEVRFVVDNLEFNEFKLPDTTIEDFSKEFQLRLYP